MARTYFNSLSRVKRTNTLHKDDTPILRELAVQLATLGFEREHTFVYDKAGSRYRLDFAHVHQQINVEFDGLNHTGVTRRAMDAKRDARLISRGWRVIRVVGGAKPGRTTVPVWSFAWQPIGQPSPLTGRVQAVLMRLFG